MSIRINYVKPPEKKETPDENKTSDKKRRFRFPFRFKKADQEVPHKNTKSAKISGERMVRLVEIAVGIFIVLLLMLRLPPYFQRPEWTNDAVVAAAEESSGRPQSLLTLHRVGTIKKLVIGEKDMERPDNSPLLDLKYFKGLKELTIYEARETDLPAITLLENAKSVTLFCDDERGANDGGITDTLPIRQCSQIEHLYIYDATALESIDLRAMDHLTDLEVFGANGSRLKEIKLPKMPPTSTILLRVKGEAPMELFDSMHKQAGDYVSIFYQLEQDDSYTMVAEYRQVETIHYAFGQNHESNEQ